jgi:DNA-binding NtrC family response regulator
MRNAVPWERRAFIKARLDPQVGELDRIDDPRENSDKPSVCAESSCPGLYLDDEPSVCTAYARLVRSTKMKLRTFDSVEEFMRIDLSDKNACVISDVRMAGISGLEQPGLLAGAGRRLPVIFVSAHDTAETRDIARRAGAAAYFPQTRG